MSTAESATLQRIQTLWDALKCQVRKLSNSDEWTPTIEEVERRIKSTGDRILNSPTRRAREPSASLKAADPASRKASKQRSPQNVKNASPKKKQSDGNENDLVQATVQDQRPSRKRPGDSILNDDLRSVTSVTSLAASRITAGETLKAGVRNADSERSRSVQILPQAPQSSVVPVYDIISVDSSIETLPLPSLSKSLNSRRVDPVTLERKDDLLADHELDRLMNKGPALRPIVSPRHSPPVVRASVTSEIDITNRRQRLDANSGLLSKAVQFESQDSDDDLISLQRSKRRARISQKEGGSCALTESNNVSPRSARISGSPYRCDANCHEEPLILSSKFFPMRDGMQEYLRVTLRDCRSVRRHPSPFPSEYIVNNSDQLFVVLDFASDEFPLAINSLPASQKAEAVKSPARSQATPSPSGGRGVVTHPSKSDSSPEKRRLALPLAPTQQMMEDIDDDESFLLSAHRKAKNSPLTLSPASRTGKNSGKKRKKNSSGKESKRNKARRKKFRQAFPYVADQRTTVYARDSLGDAGLFGDDGLGDDMYQVDAILDVMQDCRDKKMYFYVKWKDYGDEDNTWEPEENLEFGDHSARINYLKALHHEKLKVSEAIVQEANFVWKDHNYPGKYRQEFNDYMKSFVVSEKDKRETGMMEPFFVQARQWCHPQPPVNI